jgi:hypothetical protein
MAQKGKLTYQRAKGRSTRAFVEHIEGRIEEFDEAVKISLANFGVDPAFISYDGELPDSEGAEVGTKGAYFKDETKVFQILEWDGDSWVEVGSPIATEGLFLDYVADFDAAVALAEAWAEGTEPGGAGTKSAKKHSEDADARATAAGVSETNAGVSETNAGLSEAKAEKWAEEDEDIEVEAGKYSARHWAAKAAVLSYIPIIRQSYEDQYGRVYSFNESLMRNPIMSEEWAYNENKFAFARESVAYDLNHQLVDSGVPIYEPAGILGDKGILMSGQTTNLFSEAKSVTFDVAEVVALSDTYYTLSVYGGTGKLVMSGAYSGEVAVGDSLTFAVPTAGDVTFTPEDGTPEYCQLGQWAARTPWQLGGVPRERPRCHINVAGGFPSEFGIGMRFNLFGLADPDVYPNWFQRLFTGWYNTDNEFFVAVRNSPPRLQWGYTVNGVSYLHWESGFTPSLGVPYGVYFHVVAGEGIYLYSYRDGVITMTPYLDSNLPPLPSVLTQLAVGLRLRAMSQRSNFAEGVLSCLRLDLPPTHTPNPDKHFEENF